MPFRTMLRIASLALVLLAPGATSAWSQVKKEYETKAQIMSVLFGYVTWPQRSPDAGHPFTLVVLGHSPFENHLEEALARGPLKQRKIRTLFVRTLTGGLLGEADAIFICASESERVEEIIRICKGRPILLLGDTPDFARQGVMVNLIIQEGMIRSEVNLRATRQARIEIGSAFLAAAKPRIVEGP